MIIFAMFDKWRKWRYTAFVVLSCSFAFMCIGGASGWSSPSVVTLTSEDSPIKLTNDEASWVASLLAIGGLTASVPFSYLLNKIGRKPMIVAVSLTYIAGWTVLIFSKNVVHLYVGRYLLGAATGCTFGSIPLFIGEVIQQNIRGAVVTLMLLSLSVGTLTSYAVGPLVSFQTFNIICIIYPVLMFLSFMAMPESPYFLLRKGDSEAAVKALSKLRGCTYPDEINDELKNMQKFLNETPKSNFWQCLKQLSDPKSRKAIVIITVLLLGQQMSGIGAVTSYMQSIFDEVDLPIKSTYAVLIAELLADVSVVVTSFVMDSFGRKPLYSISAVACTFANVLLGLFYLLRSNGMMDARHSWIAMVGVFVLRMGYDLGLSPVPMVVTSEILSFNIRSIVGSYFAFIQGGTMAIVMKMYQVVKDGMGEQYVHWVFAFSVFLSMVFTMYYMPETKNKSLAEIQEDLGRRNKSRKELEMDVLEKGVYTIKVTYP